MSSPARSTFRIDTAQLLPQGLARALYRPIRGLVERLSGIRALEGLHEKGHRAGGGVRGFCDAVLAELELTFDIDIPALTALASQGKPLILMGNHPLGGPEALALCAALEQACPGRYLLMANQVLQHIPALQPILVTVNPDWTQSPAKNAASLRTAYRHLRSGGVLALFPAGRVSGPSELDPQLTTDLPWTDQPLRMAEKAGASLATFHVTGQCSSTFLSIPTQWPHFRALRLIREMTHPAVRHAQFRFGPALLPSQFIRGGSTERTAKRMRARCYALPDAEQMPPTPKAKPTTTAPSEPQTAIDLDAIHREIETLRAKGSILVEAQPLSVLFFQGCEATALLAELGRQREITFRAAGQGVGHAIDLSPEDQYYHHLVIWDHDAQCLVGAYRVGFTDRILAEQGLDGLYLSHVFEIDRSFFDRIGPAMELSRSIVVPDYQRDPRALSLLWRGLGTLIARDPRYSTAFGSVTISNAFRPASRAYLKTFLETHHSDSPNLRRLIRERQPFQCTTLYHHEVVSAFAADEITALKILIEEIEDGQRTVPPLIRYYLNLGAKFLGFHVEAAFNDALYCLLRVDLRSSDPRHLKRFLGSLPDSFTTSP